MDYFLKIDYFVGFMGTMQKSTLIYQSGAQSRTCYISWLTNHAIYRGDGSESLDIVQGRQNARSALHLPSYLAENIHQLFSP